MAFRKTVLFGPHPVWEKAIRSRLDPAAYACRFEDLAQADLIGVDVVVPLLLSHFVALEGRGAAVREKALIPPRKVVRACHDKLEFNRRLGASEFAAMVPRVLDAASARPPFVLKRRRAAGGAHTHLVETERDADRLRDLIAHPDYFLQDIVPGDREYAMHILFSRGRPIFHQNVAYQMDSTTYVKSGDFRHLAMTFRDGHEHLDRFVDIMTMLGLDTGSCCIDYKVVGGQVCVFEVNPRFGASLVYRITPYVKAYEAALTERLGGARHADPNAESTL